MKKERHWVLPAIWAILLMLLLGGAVWAYQAFSVADWQSLDPSRLTSLAQTGAIHDKNGDYVTSLVGKENRTVIDTSRLPAHVVNAFLAAEDLRFYKHPGFDITRIIGAMLTNVRDGAFSQGASTISQQLIKLSHLSSQKTIARKLEEIHLALQLEKQYSKDEILDMYLNFIYFGQGAYGVQAAAEVTFGVDAAELTPAQAASLAAAIKAPSAYSLQSAPESNRERREYILSIMLEENMLTQAEYDAAMAEELTARGAPQVQTDYGWFVDAVLDEAENRLDVSAETLLAGGYRIDTTLDPDMQRIMDEQYLTDVFPADNKDGTPVQAASAAVDTSSGAVRAIVGGRKYVTRRGLNRATQLRRQPGSALKPLAVYAPAIESAGWTCASVILDAPTAFGTYKPRNAGNAYYGNVTVRTALKNSLNIPAVKVLQAIGVQTAQRYLRSVGIELDERDANLSLALGSMTYGTSPMQMAAAYAPFANGGTYYAPYFIERITDRDGNVIYERETTGTRVLSAQSAYLMTSLLKTVISSGTGTRLSSAGTPVAGKTGTNSDQKGVFFAGMTGYYSSALWVGHDNYKALSSKSTGSRSAAPLWQSYMSKIHQGLSNRDILEGSASDYGLVKVTTCAVSGQLATDACRSDAMGYGVVTDYWKAGTEPTVSCQMHTTQTICSVSGLLASPYCPDTVTRGVLTIPSGHPLASFIGTEYEDVLIEYLGSYAVLGASGTCPYHTSASSSGSNTMVENTLIPDAKILLSQAYAQLQSMDIVNDAQRYSAIQSAITNLEYVISLPAPTTAEVASAMGQLTQAMAGLY